MNPNIVRRLSEIDEMKVDVHLEYLIQFFLQYTQKLTYEKWSTEPCYGLKCENGIPREVEVYSDCVAMTCW